MAAEKIESQIVNQVNHIVLPNMPAQALANSLELESKQWLVSPETIHVFDLSQVATIDQNVLTAMLVFQKNLKRCQKQLFFINLKPAVSGFFDDRGALESVVVKNSLDQCFPTPAVAPKKKVQLNVGMISPFIEGASKSFEVQLGWKLKPGKPYSKTHKFEKDDSIVGQIDVNLPTFKGQISLCFQKSTFIAVYEALLDEKIETIDDGNSDAACELLNMIYGHAKTVLNKNFGMVLQPAIPKAILNPKVTPSTNPVLAVPFDSDKGLFRIEILIIS